MEVTPIRLGYTSQEEAQKGIVTMFTEDNGQLVVHRKFELSKLIEGDDLIIKQEIVL